jgi:hypothetical protein
LVRAIVADIDSDTFQGFRGVGGPQGGAPQGAPDAQAQTGAP